MTRKTFTGNKRGFSLIELCIVLAILSILAGSITPVFIKSIQIKAGEKTSLEMSVIQQAALGYFVANNAWPQNLSALQNAGYLDAGWVTNNPWQNPYNVSSTASTFTVSTNVPQEWTNLVARDLPSTSISANTVRSTIPVPGTIPNQSLPVGAIVIWSGNVASIPSEWQLCDGTNGTPDLRDRFIVGAKQDDAGIAKTNVTGSLTQSGDGQIPAHAHTVSIPTMRYQAGGDTNGLRADGAGSYPGGPLGTGSYGTGTKNVAVYYALAFIMKS